MEELQRKLRDTEEQLSQAEDNVQYYKRQVEHVQAYLKQKGEECHFMSTDVVEQIKEYVRYRIKTSEKTNLNMKLAEKNVKLRSDIHKQEVDMEEMKVKKNKHKWKSEVLESNTKELSTRLSKIAGAHLTRDNPNIADLSDDNRPTKLGEAFSELYDNEWTDAFEEMGQKGKTGEKSNICTLMDLLKMVHNECRLISQNYADLIQKMKTVKIEIAGVPEKMKRDVSRDFSLDENTGKMVSEVTADVSFSAEHEKTVFDMRLLCIRSLETQKQISKIIATKIATERNMIGQSQPNLVQYLTKCAHLCWYMVHAKHPVFIDFPSTKGTEDKFDANRFKAYTKTGRKLDFVVWPALYLHENGPLLCKGVAQGRD